MINDPRNHTSDSLSYTAQSQALSAELAEFFAISIDPLCIIGMDGYFKKVNPAFITLLEYSEQELLSRPYFEFIHPDDVAATKRRHKLLEEDLEVNSFENRYQKKSGEYCWLLWSYKMSNDNGMIYAVAKDHTTQRLAENALEESEKRYKSIFTNAPLPMWIYDADTLRFLNINQTAIEHYGYSIGEFLRMSLLELYHRSEHKKVLQLVNTLKTQQATATYYATHIKKSGECIFVEVTSVNIHYQNKPARMVIVNDISEKTMLQEKLRNEELTRERKIAQATIAAQEREREFIGKELHDNINQILASTKLYLDIAQEKVEMQNNFIEKSKGNLMHAINEIRALSKSLVPYSLKDLSFVDAIEELLEPYLSSQTFLIHFTFEGPLNTLHDDLKLILFRVIQEQLTNIAKHANAKKVWLNIKYSNTIRLIIKDNGKGFDPYAKREGIGISNIKNRVSMFQGRVDIISAPGKGTSLEVVIPVPVLNHDEA
jgi:PAS domain S-box-containing protein